MYLPYPWDIKLKINHKPGIKACLCTKGFQEEQNFRADIPTCSREEVKCLFSLITSKKWLINSIDVETAFLQGKELERNVLVRPPKEAETNKIWHLNNCLYDLADVSCYLHLKVREELCKLGERPSNLDREIFYPCKFSEAIGVIILFVDNLIWAGKSTFTNIIDKFRKTFQIGTEFSKTFTYVGINIRQNKDLSITINQ